MKRFAAGRSLDATVLHRGDLTQLVDLGSENMSDDISVEISTYVDNMEFEADSVEEFLALEGMPDCTENIRLVVMTQGDASDAIDAHVTVTVNPYSGRIFVSSTNATWGVGKLQRLNRFLRSKRPWYWWVRKVQGAFVFVGPPVSAGLATRAFQLGGILSGVAFALLALALLATYVLMREERVFPVSKIVLEDKRNGVSLEAISLVVNCAALAVAVFALLKGL